MFSIYQEIPEIPVRLQMEHDFSVCSTGKFPEKVELLGAFHYAKLTGQRSVGIPEENGTTFSDKAGPTNTNGSCHFKFFFRIP